LSLRSADDLIGAFHQTFGNNDSVLSRRSQVERETHLTHQLERNLRRTFSAQYAHCQMPRGDAVVIEIPRQSHEGAVSRLTIREAYQWNARFLRRLCNADETGTGEIVGELAEHVDVASAKSERSVRNFSAGTDAESFDFDAELRRRRL